MRLLDLFCCGGGAARGYAKAGFEVVGVDNEPQPNFPFQFFQGDALEYLWDHGHKFDAIHASPPCQGYSPHVSSRNSRWTTNKGKDEPQLIARCRDLLSIIGTPWVIENVMGARNEMHANLVLCGSMFGLPIRRHRLFETSFPIDQPAHPKCQGAAKKFAEKHGWAYRDMSVTGKGRHAGTSSRWAHIMGLPYGEMTQKQIAEALPPAYTEYIGKKFVEISS